jgi:hypothetical protein
MDDKRSVEKEVVDWLRELHGHIGIDRPSNFDYIVEFMVDDIKCAADEIDWHSGDIAIAYRRLIETAEE